MIHCQMCLHHFFDAKVKNLMEKTSIDVSVCNGKKLVKSENKMFMSSKDVTECILSLRSKNSEGFYRIPHCILVDGVDILQQPLSHLLGQIYMQRKGPEQWLMAKTIPVFKNKGAAQKIENYRPITNLCSTFKIFEKLRLKRMNEIQDIRNEDLTCKGQHGLKKLKHTDTLAGTTVNYS